MEWNKSELVKMIHLFKGKPELWDTDCEDYKYRQKKQESWNEIAQQMNMGRRNVERKMRSLIGQYHREVRKTEDGSRSKWFGYELLSFLKDKINKKMRTESSNGPKTTHHEMVYLYNNDSRDESFEYNNDDDDNTQTNISATNQYSSGLKRETTSIDEELPMKRHSNIPIRDEFSIFGEHVACKIRNITDPFLRCTLQNKINNIIYATEVQIFKKAYPSRAFNSQTQRRLDAEVTSSPLLEESLQMTIEDEDRKVFPS